MSEDTVRMHCDVCGKDLGYSEYKRYARPVTCKACLRVIERKRRKGAWNMLTQHFAGNTTSGVTHDRGVVAAARVVRSGWAGDTFVMISGGRKMVRYWHHNSPGNPGLKRRK